MKRKNMLLLGICAMMVGCGTPQTNADANATSVVSEEAEVVLTAEYCLSVAEEEYNNGNYEESLKYLNEISEYELKSDYLNKIATHYIETKDLINAQNVIDIIKTYNEEDAHELQIKLKYSHYVYKPFPYDGGEYGHKLESHLSTMDVKIFRLYGIWYDHDANRRIEITDTTIDGKYYYVYSIYQTSSYPKMYYFFAEDPEKIYGIEFYDSIEIEGDLIMVDTIFDVSANEYADGIEYSGIRAYDITEAEMDEIYAEIEERLQREAEEEAKAQAEAEANAKKEAETQANYFKYEVYKTAANRFDEVVDDAYTAAEQLYMSIDYQRYEDVVCTYNPDTQVYYIRFQVTVNENVFDFWGVSTTIYTVQAELYQSGNKFLFCSFDIGY